MISKERKTLACNKPAISNRIVLEPEFLISSSVSTLLLNSTHSGKIQINLTSVWSSSDLLKNETMHCELSHLDIIYYLRNPQIVVIFTFRMTGLLCARSGSH